VSATFTYIAGYEPRSTVTTHAQIDLDAKDIIKHEHWPANNAAAYMDCAANACNWDGAAMYPSSLWDGTCTHDMVIPENKVDTTANTITFTAHGLSDGNKVKYYKGTGNVITNLVDKTEYFVVSKTTDTFQVSLTSGGDALSLGSAGDMINTLKDPGSTPLPSAHRPTGFIPKGKTLLNLPQCVLSQASQVPSAPRHPVQLVLRLLLKTTSLSAP
jgi:hypothetical protein